MNNSNYLKYRGKCKEMSEALVAKNPEMTLVRGHYYEPAWDRKEPHWWCVDENGEIVDPTALQFPSGGISEFYEEYNGFTECAECGCTIEERNIIPMGNYPVCSGLCARRLVGI